MQKRFAFLALAIAVVLVLPFAVTSPYYLHLIQTIAIYAIVALGLDIVFGYTGEVSIGHAALFGIGAYAAAILVHQFPDFARAHPLILFWVGIVIAPIAAAAFGAILALRGIRGAQAVVSGLGWSATRPGREDSLLPVVARALADDGVFVQFAYCATAWAAPARALRAELDECFAAVETSPVVWRNLPPAVVYRASSPRR